MAEIVGNQRKSSTSANAVNDSYDIPCAAGERKMAPKKKPGAPSPLRVWRSFRSARGQRTLYRNPDFCESMMQMTVGEVRSRLSIPPDGFSQR